MGRAFTGGSPQDATLRNVLLWLLLGALASGGVLRASWWRNRRAWRAEQARSRRWLLAHGIDPGSTPADPAAWKLVLTPELSAGGRFP